MAAPVNAPAAAPAAAPIDAPRTWPVAAPPMIAPVAAPHAAPWPTGVSHEVRVQKIRATPDATTAISLFMMQIRSRLKSAVRRMLRGRSQDSLCRPELVLGIYKYVLCTHVQD
jgi:hypothetical protein